MSKQFTLSSSKGSQQGHFREVSPHVKSDELERGILEFWEKENIFDKSLEQTKNGPPFTFYDGPPYATGQPHYGHILQSAIKDTALRYKTMQGYYAPRRVGWDCHGLPIENIVEKELGIASKREIEQDIEGFNKQCRKTVHRYVDMFADTLKRIGRWADYENAYSTLDRDYMESEWWAFRQVWDQKLVYKAYRSTPYCIRCATALSNFEVASNYKDRVDTAVYALLAVREDSSSALSLSKGPSTRSARSGPNEQFLLIWTTTPWTLPGNAAVAIHPDITYVTALHEGKRLIMAKERVPAVLGEDAKIEKKWNTDELLQLRYEPLYSSSLSDEGKEVAFRVVLGEHVTAEEGTGLVHIAPAFGEEDYEIGQKEHLPTLRTVDVLGNFTADVSLWAGENIFAASEKIVADLEERGLLLKREQYTHSYPFCWRCDTPLIYYALDSWFVNVTQLKPQMLKNNEQIQWIPEHVKHGRFKKGIESAPDWAVSRNRFWSVPIPIWECNNVKCAHRVCVGSIAELQELSGASEAAVADIHRPYVDGITWPCQECAPPSPKATVSRRHRLWRRRVGKGGTMKRVPEVLDVWFDSASMPYSGWHYPFERKETVEKTFPADFIAESIEMTRAWFYVLHVLATALTQKDIGLGKHKPAFSNAIASGLIFAEDGQKLSKKLKNYPEIDPTLKTYGADVLRFYLLSSTSLGEPYRFSEKDMQQMQRNVYLTLWNVYSFFVRYANVHGWSAQPMSNNTSKHLLDRWIVARVHQLEVEVTTQADTYHLDTAARLFTAFIDDLSNWYVRRSRSRFQKIASEEDRRGAFQTLYEVLVRVAKLLAPFMPFVSEELFRNLTGELSVHLQRLEKPEEVSEQERQILEQMAEAREIVSEGLAVRAREGIKVRQPLADMVVGGHELSAQLADIIREEVNVKKVLFGQLPAGDAYARSADDARVAVALNTKVTATLKAEGVAREIIRHGQLLRRKAGYALDDRITLVLRADDQQLAGIIKAQQEMVARALQADSVTTEAAGEDASADVKIEKQSVHIGVSK